MRDIGTVVTTCEVRACSDHFRRQDADKSDKQHGTNISGDAENAGLTRLHRRQYPSWAGLPRRGERGHVVSGIRSERRQWFLCQSDGTNLTVPRLLWHC